MVQLFELITSALLMSGCGLIPRTGTHSEALKVSVQRPVWSYIYSFGLAGVAPPSIMNQGMSSCLSNPERAAQGQFSHWLKQ